MVAWLLTLEFGVGASAVARSWGEKVMESGFVVWWCHYINRSVNTVRVKVFTEFRIVEGDGVEGLIGRIVLVDDDDNHVFTSY